MKFRYILIAVILFCTGVLLAIVRYADNSESTGDSAIVLGAAAWNGKPSPVFKARIDHAIELYENDSIQKIYFTGGTDYADQLSEAETARDYAVEHGVDLTNIEVETTSQTTMGNLMNISSHIRPNEKVLIVTDPLHEYRAVRMARRLGIDAYPSPTPYTKYETPKTQIPFLLRETYFMIIFWLFRI